MTRFDRALEDLLSPRVEGFYSAPKPSDPGGETVYGVARERWPAWEGWPLVDAARCSPGGVESIRHDPELRRMVRHFYLVNFWHPLRCEDLPEPVGERVFDIGVNAGTGRVVQILQIALVALDRRDVEIDGRLGPVTLTAAEKVGSTRLYDALQGVQGGFYLGLTVARSALARNLPGWLRRALTSAPGTEDE